MPLDPTRQKFLQLIDSAAETCNARTIRLQRDFADDDYPDSPSRGEHALFAIALHISYANTIAAADFYMRHIKPALDEDSDA